MRVIINNCTYEYDLKMKNANTCICVSGCAHSAICKQTKGCMNEL